MGSRLIRGVYIALLILFAAPLWAQIDNGNITGRVSDSTGAVIAGAQVSIVQTEMNFETATQTNAEGIYRAQSLRPGPYRITITSPGFKRLVREGLELRPADTMAVNITLDVGAVSESVEVTASAPLLQTETSATGTVVTGDYFYRLPNYQRNVYGALFFTPGVQYGNNTWTGNLGGMQINGLRSGAIGFFEDGQLGTTGDGMTTGTITNTIEDIKVITTTLPAEYGHSAGGAISVVKKSGTNQLHGLVSEFGRTRRMQHRKYFDLYRNSQVQPGWSKPPGLIFQQPDANLSGPVVIPKIYDGRNKTFFMVAFQWMLEKQSKQQSSTVPSLDMLNGDFNFGGIGQTIYDPRSRRQLTNGNWTADPFANKMVPKAQWSKVAQNILSKNPYLAPNVAGSVTATGPSGNIMTGPMKIVRWDNWSTRIDQQFTPNIKAYGTWTFNQRWERQPPWTKPANNMFDSSLNINKTRQHTYSAGVTWIMSPTIISDIRAGYYRYGSRTNSIAYLQDYAGQLGIPNLSKDTMPQGIGPATSGAGAVTESLNVGAPSLNMREILTLKDDTTKVKGTHAIKFGYELLRYRRNEYTPRTPAGTFTYTSTAGVNANGTNLANTGNNFAAFLVGAVSSVAYERTIMSSLPRVWQNSFYIQDDWKIRPSLTLNLGLRYSVETPPSNKYGEISIWDPAALDTSVYTNYTCPAGGCKGAFTHPKGAHPFNMDKNNWDPRIGLAWHPLQKLVVRTGFALTHMDMRDNFLYTNELISESTSQAQPLGDVRPLFMIDAGPPQIIYPSRRADGSVPYRGNPGSQGTINYVDRNIQSTYTMSWNYSLQYELSTDYMVELLYKGSSQVGDTGGQNINSRPLGIIPDGSGGFIDLNQPQNAALRSSWLNNTQPSRPFPNWADVRLQGNNGHLSHHEGSVRLEKRFSRGFNFQAFYTLQRTLSGNSNNYSPYLNWGLTKSRVSYDQTHNLTGSLNYQIPIGQGRKWLNHGGILNTLIGGFDFVWSYTIASGSPLGISISNSPFNQQYPSWMGTYGDVMLLKVPSMRDGWQDLGDRFTQNNQNSAIACGNWVQNWGNDCMVARPNFTNGTNGANLWDRQRMIAASFSASKEVPIKERLKFMFRFDFQNPLKWFNWGAPTTSLPVNSAANARSFGTYQPGGEATTAAYGGLPLMNITLALKW